MKLVKFYLKYKNDIATNARNMSNEEFNVEFVKDNITNEEYYKVQGNTALLYITEDGTVTTYLNTSPTTLYSDYWTDAYVNYYDGKEKFRIK